MRTMRTAIALALAAAALGAPLVQGYAKYIKLVPNGGDVPDASNIGHLSPDGSTGLNDFGNAFGDAGDEWNVELCMEDSDGDGYTNGQELGDPCCTWTPTNTAGLITEGVSHPSDASKIPTNDALLEGCSASTTTGGSSNGTAGGGGINDVLAPVKPGSSSAMPDDDDENDSDEMAEIKDAAAASATLSALAALVSAAAALALAL